jgi:hypothetical protein
MPTDFNTASSFLKVGGPFGDNQRKSASLMMAACAATQAAILRPRQAGNMAAVSLLLTIKGGVSWRHSVDLLLCRKALGSKKS